MPWHEVKQGDTLMALASRYGLASWKQIFDRPENRALRERGAEPGILKVGERVFVPNKEMRHEAALVDQRHSFRVSPPSAFLRLAVRDGAGRNCVGCRYVLEVEAQTVEGKVTPDGIVEHPVPVTARSGRLSLWLDGAREAEVWELDIGAMDPPEEISGVQARLDNLGYDCGAEEGDLGPQTEVAIRAFQGRASIEPSGQVDEDLIQELVRYYDPDTAEFQESVPEPGAGTEDSGAGASEVSGTPSGKTQAANTIQDQGPAETSPLQKTTRKARVQLVEIPGQRGDKLHLPTWVEFQLLGEDDQPVAGYAYRLELPGGKILEGQLDGQGSARLEGLPPGVGRVCFPELDSEAWELVQIHEA